VILRAVVVLAVLALGGCAGLPMALSVAGGVVVLAKDVIGLDVSLKALTTPPAQPGVATQAAPNGYARPAVSNGSSE
jgi:hypothetical protein